MADVVPSGGAEESREHSHAMSRGAPSAGSTTATAHSDSSVTMASSRLSLRLPWPTACRDASSNPRAAASKPQMRTTSASRSRSRIVRAWLMWCLRLVGLEQSEPGQLLIFIVFNVVLAPILDLLVIIIIIVVEVFPVLVVEVVKLVVEVVGVFSMRSCEEQARLRAGCGIGWIQHARARLLLWRYCGNVYWRYCARENGERQACAQGRVSGSLLLGAVGMRPADGECVRRMAARAAFLDGQETEPAVGALARYGVVTALTVDGVRRGTLAAGLADMQYVESGA